MTIEHSCFDKSCKSRNKVENLSLIYIEWKDASYQDGPSYIGNIISDALLKTGGLLVQETETHFSVALDFYESDATWRHITNIPKGMIVKVQRFPIEIKPEEKLSNCAEPIFWAGIPPSENR